MTTHHEEKLLPHSPQQMFDLVADVARYPEFLPWCDQASVLEHLPEGMVAQVGIAFGGVRQVFTTRNTHTTDRRVALQLVQGPFSQLEGQWNFHAIGDGLQRACKVELSLQYGFDSGLLAKLIGPVFDKIAASLVDAFVKRAEAVYG